MTFQQKYTPQSFGDLIFPDSNTRQRLLEFANNKRHGSLIFHGPYGTAKTTTAKKGTAKLVRSDFCFIFEHSITSKVRTRFLAFIPKLPLIIPISR